jgi:hypothetical protein
MDLLQRDPDKPTGDLPVSSARNMRVAVGSHPQILPFPGRQTRTRRLVALNTVQAESVFLGTLRVVYEFGMHELIAARCGQRVKPMVRGDTEARCCQKKAAGTSRFCGASRDCSRRAKRVTIVGILIAFRGKRIWAASSRITQ